MNDTPGNIKIIARIRGMDMLQSNANINTLESVGSLEKSPQNKKSGQSNLQKNKTTTPTARSTSITRSKSPGNTRKATPVIKKDKLVESSNYTIFTASNPSNTIVVTPRAISGKLINDTFNLTNDLYEYSYSILKSATLLEFDRVYNETHKLDTIYNDQLKESISNLFNGKSSCCILFGPSESGKSYTLRGPSDSTANEYGIIGRVIHDVLNLVELSKQTMLNQNKHKQGIYYAAKISVYQVYLDQVNDLMSTQYHKNLSVEKYFDEERNMIKSHINELTEKEIKTKSDYENYMREVVYNRRSLANFLRINDVKRKSNLIFSLIIEKRERVNEGFKRSADKTIERYAQIDFVELAASNYGLSGQGKSNQLVTLSPDYDPVLFKNISRTFNSICNNIVSASVGVVPKNDTKLTLALKNTLNYNSNIIFLACVLPSEEPPTRSLKCLKFTNWLRNQIYNLHNNRDYKIKSAYEESEEETVQRDHTEYKRDYSDKYEDNKFNLDSYTDFDNYYNYKRRQLKDYKEDKSPEDLYELPQRFSTHGSNYISQDGGKSININEHQSLYDKYQAIERGHYPIRSHNLRKEFIYNKPEHENVAEDYEYEQITSEKGKPKMKKVIKYDSQEEDDHDPDYIEAKIHRSINKGHKTASSQQNIIIEDNNQIEKDKKLYEVERSIRDLEAKSIEMSRYIESMKAEKSRIHEDSLHNINMRSSCDCEIEQIKQEASTIKSDNIIFREDINRLSEINRHLEEELARQRTRNLELAAENEKLSQDKNQMKCEIEKLNDKNSNIKLREHSLMEQMNMRFITENRIRDLEIENKTLREEKQKYEVDFKVLLERHTEIKKLYEQNENELNFIKIKQSEEVNNIENKIEKMAKQIDLQQRENSQLRLGEERMRQDISNLEKQRDNYREKYQDNKLKNNMLNTKLKEIEDDFRKLMIEKQAEQMEKMKEHETKKMKIDSKQKILEDMQNRIASYKADILKQRKRKDE